MTEARRRASQAYKERQEREGIKVVSVRLCKEVRDKLARGSKRSGVSQSRAIEMLVNDAFRD